MLKDIKSIDEMQDFGEMIGRHLKGGEIIELVGDVGAGKTTMVKGLAAGLDIDDTIQSPSFTISRQYDGRDNLRLVHYDFYRLDNNVGIMDNELREVINDPMAITVIEWAKIVAGTLPDDRLTVEITTPTITTRHLVLTAGGPNSLQLLERIEL
jgi:tRNA threonylcarbamoyladenosine biosynthesis protein TsaE